MNRTSNQLKGYSGANPFHEGKAKAFTDRKLIEEFFPTSAYWSRFNQQHEILIGTRGSGKTAILKMLSYSWLRDLKDSKATILQRDKPFIGFYIPLHLEFIASLPGSGCDDEHRLQYFQFAFNCAAIKALVRELKALLSDCFSDIEQRLRAEAKLIIDLKTLWFPNDNGKINTVEEFQWKVELLYRSEAFWRDGTVVSPHPFAQSLFWPVTPALPRIALHLGLNSETTTWVACIDEAEFLNPPFIRCVNSFLRSETTPIVVKLATLPFKHQTKDTTANTVSVQAEGNDFNYRVIDLDPDSPDFVGLTNSICAGRLRKCGVNEGPFTLEAFLGNEGDDDLIDYFRAELPPEETTEEAILAGVIKSLSTVRQKRFETVKNIQARVSSDFYKKFAPIFYYRRMRVADRQGNRTAGWFAGGRMVRRISDGNPRRYIQIMNDLFEAARQTELTPKAQHRIVAAFCKRHFESSEGLPGYGILLKRLISVIGELLEKRVHGPEMLDAGSNFFVHEDLLENPTVLRALELGIGYSIFFADEVSLTQGLTENSEFRLGNMVAAVFWVPMQKGGRVLLQSKHAKDALIESFHEVPPATSKESGRFVENLQLEFSVGESDDIKA